MVRKTSNCVGLLKYKGIKQMGVKQIGVKKGLSVLLFVLVFQEITFKVSFIQFMFKYHIVYT